ncbi:MAG: hypothetical protein GF392_01365 [Candidatus Omnitrophica bacterium]|nr:hypothetical protein [Candidatus Omnitrophota bacterium]
MKKSGKVVTLITLLSFTLNFLIHDNSYGLTAGKTVTGDDLAVPSMFDDILKTHKRDMDAIRLIAEANQKLLREKSALEHAGLPERAADMFQPEDI